METTYAFALGDRRYEIRMVSAGELCERWYGTWIDGKLDGTKNPWPLDAKNNPLSEEQLIADKVALETKLYQKREEAVKQTT